MTYKETLAFLFYQLPMYQRKGPVALKKDLTNIIELCKCLDNPQKSYKSIHIAGTNGKGTVSHIIASILQEQGMKVGLYTSPHYKDFRERIKINGKFISKKEVVVFVNRIKSIAQHINPSFFEISVAMAFDHFKRNFVDIAVIETGLGGRLDSTNIIMPEISVITNIGLDHTQFLGDTHAEIAFEKAGIIKREIPVIVGSRSEKTDPVFIRKAEQENSELHFAQDMIKVHEKNDSIQFIINKSTSFIVNRINMDPFFIENARTALSAIQVLNKKGKYNIGNEKMIHGLERVREQTYYIGRWHLLSDSPLIIADSAHNYEGLSPILNQIQNLKYNQLHIIIGFVKDKNLKKVIPLFPREARYYFVKADIPRGLEREILKEAFDLHGLKGRSYVSVKGALRAAKRSAKSEDLIFIGGSIFVVAEVL